MILRTLALARPHRSSSCINAFWSLWTVPAFVKVVVASLHAATSIESGMARSGFNQTTFPNTQLRVAPDQRFG